MSTKASPTSRRSTRSKSPSRTCRPTRPAASPRFAYLLSRVAHADHEVTDAEREAMVRLLVDRAHLAPEQAAIVIGLATSKIVHVRGTEDYLVSREVAARATIEEKRALIDGLYAVCAADGLISTIEDNDVRRVASEIDLEHHDVVDIRASRYLGSQGSRLQRPSQCRGGVGWEWELIRRACGVYSTARRRWTTS